MRSIPRGSHLPGAGRRRAAPRHGLPVVESPLPQCFPGQGDLPLDEFMDALAGDRFRRPPSRSRSSTTSFRAAARRAQVADRRPSIARDLPARSNSRDRTRPADCRVGGVAGARAVSAAWSFIEFAIDDHSAGGILRSRCSTGLGFRREPVSTVSQGGDALVPRATSIVVLNSDRRKGFAHSLQHHPRQLSVCAHRDPKVDDASAPRSIARQLLLDTAVPPGRRSGRARDPGGARPGRQPDLLHRWRRPISGACGISSSGPVASAERRDGSRSDDGSITCRNRWSTEEMLSWLLFLHVAARLSGRRPLQDVLDPGGLLKSQVVQVEPMAACASCSTARRVQSAPRRRAFSSEALRLGGPAYRASPPHDLVATVEASARQRRADAAHPGQLLR